MTLSASTLNFASAILVGAFLVVPQFVGSAQAGVADELRNCTYNSRQKTIACCEQVLKVNNKPIWMRTADNYCSSMSKCSSSRYSNQRRCYVKLEFDQDFGSSSKGSRRQLEQR